MERQCSSYREVVLSHLASLLAATPLTFLQILRKSYNCDPTTLKEAIDTLVSRHHIVPVESGNGKISYKLVQKDIRVLSYCFVKSLPSIPAVRTQLPHFINPKFLEDLVKTIEKSMPEASPVYSQWWFSSRSYHRLLSLIFQYLPSNAPTAFLACPTLGAVFSNVTDSPVQILDVDKILLTKLSHYCSQSATLTEYDVAAIVPSPFRSRFGFVFVDPPWSRSLLKTFLVRASALSSLGGSVAISLPPVLTRPLISSERKKFLGIAHRLGLRLRTILPSFTAYSVPDFERSAYEQIGLLLDKPWRTGDLFVFTKCAPNPVEVDTQPPFISKWDQYLWGKHRLFLKRDNSCEKGAPAIRFVHGLRSLKYPSTSSRSKSWTEASLVSTRNYIAHAQGRKVFASLLGNILRGSECNSDILNVRPHLFTELKKTVFSMLGINSKNSPRGV
jgi:hypothetical protein